MRIAYALSLFLAAHTRVSVLDLRRIRPSGKRRTRSISHARKNGLKGTGRNLKETAPSRMDLYTSFAPRESRQHPFTAVEGEAVEFKPEGAIARF